MNSKTVRKIVHIDQDKCNGCGLCIPNCHEGAIKIVDGKARLVAENLCDGLGACLGKCPMDAIRVEERAADLFDESAVAAHRGKMERYSAAAPTAGNNVPVAPHPAGGCPGSRLRMLQPPAAAAPADRPNAPGRPSQLGQWPVQLALVPVTGPMWENADVLIAADCVPFAYPEFHEKLLAGKSLAIACPKLDNVEPYIEKLSAIFALNTVRSVTVAHMEVPCCSGIVRAVREALQHAQRMDLPVTDIIVGIGGTVENLG